jgi:hypothetical protein
MAASANDVFRLNRMNKLAREVGLGDLVNIQVYDSAASAGGAATETLTVTGLATGDTILAVSQLTKGANGTALIKWTDTSRTANQLAVEWTGNPGAGAVVRVLVLKAASTT